MNLITELNQKYSKQKITDFKVGDTVKVHQKIIEGGKERIQIFEGVVIKTRAGKNINGTFTVRKISEGVGVERIYLVHSPKITKIEVVKRGKVRRANLSYLRNLRGKKARLKEKQFDSLIVNVAEEPIEQPNNETASNAAGATEQQETQKEDGKEKIENKGKEMSNKKKGNSEENDSDNDSDEEVTELKTKDEEDEEKLKEMSVEKLAELEAKASKKAHKKEEEDIERDETEDVEEETDLGLEKAEDEDTRGQQEKPRKK